MKPLCRRRTPWLRPSRARLALLTAFAALSMLASLASCSRIYVDAPVGGVPSGDTRELSVIYLIGDFGKPSASFRDLVAGIGRDVAAPRAGELRTSPMIFELGDNLYEEGLPHDLGLPGAQDEVDKLRAIAATFTDVRHEDVQVPVVLIPGNHDYGNDALARKGNLGDISRWYFLDELGIDGVDSWTHVPGDPRGFTDAAALFGHLEGDAAAHAEFMAPMRVPHTDPDVYAVAIDSELMLDLYDKGHDDLAAAYWEELDRVLAAAPDGAWLMVAAHHPPATYGKHGEPSLGNWVFGQGYPQFPYAWQKALAVSLPLGIALGVLVHPAAVVVAAIPPVATVFATRRKQDVGSPHYDRYATALLDRAARYDVDVVLAGHDHNTQIIELAALDGFDGDTVLVVTGAGSKVDPVRRGLGTVAYLSNYSWVRMTQYARGLSFEIIDRQGGSRYRYDLSR